MRRTIARAASLPKPFANRKRRPELKKEALLKTAAHLFLEKGFRGTSMDDIAEQLDITKPALYHYFKNKEELLIGCYHSGFRDILARMERALKPEHSGIEKVRAFLHAWIEIVTTTEFGRCVATLDDMELSPVARDGVRKLKKQIDLTLRKNIGEGIADGTLKPCDARLVAFAFGGAVNAIGIWYDPRGKLKPEEFADTYAAILIHGVGAAPAPRKKTSSKRSSEAKS
jgi:AcrR family transcriptional regulator